MSDCTVNQKWDEWTKIAKLREVFHDRNPEPVELAGMGPKKYIHVNIYENYRQDI